MLYVLIHTVLAVKFVVGLWNRVYYLCTLYVLKGKDRGYERGWAAHINRWRGHTIGIGCEITNI